MVMAVVTYAVSRLAGRGAKFMGTVGMNAMTRSMSFLTMCIGVQFVVNGVLDPELLRALRVGLSIR